MSDVLNIELIKNRMLRKYPAFASVINNVKYEVTTGESFIDTAATDGKTIFFNNQFVSNLSQEEQVFIFAHETCHIALNHILRSENKDHRLWNIATDAIINEHLKKDGLPIIKGGVELEDALNYDAEELYKKLLEEKKKEQDKSQETQDNIGQNDNKAIDENMVGHDSHKLWEDAVKQAKEEQLEEDKNKKQNDTSNSTQEKKQDEKLEEDKNNKQKGTNNSTQDKKQGEKKDDIASNDDNISEKQIFEQNENMKKEKAQKIMEKINNSRKNSQGNGFEQRVGFGDVGVAKRSATNWKRVLKRYLDVEDERWGDKFSFAPNYSKRIEDYEYDEKITTEVILDVSGSVDIELLREFLRQMKSIVKFSEIKVGTFSNEFNGWEIVKTKNQINELNLPIGGGTNFDAASKAFSYGDNINRVCFTDGDDSFSNDIVDKRNDILWVSFENPNFKPDNGKVIFAPREEIMNYARENDLLENNRLESQQ